MNKNFWRPFFIIALAVVLLGVVTQFIPALDNKLLPIKKLDMFKNLANAFQTSPEDSLAALAKGLHIESKVEPILNFANKLADYKQNKSGSIRIAYFGDSIIEGDLISGKLREQLQINYGGSGVGLVPITSIVNEFRRTIKHRFSRNWETLSFMKKGSGNIPLGMIGYTFIPRNYYIAESVIENEPQPVSADTLSADTTATPPPPQPPRKESKRFYLDGPSWVEYAGVQFTGGAAQFNKIRLFYSNASESSYVNVAQDGGELRKYSLCGSPGLQVLDLSPSAPISKIRLEFNPQDPIYVYGVSFDNTQGIYVDNLSVRGYSGMYFNAIPTDFLSAFQNNLGYDLIILQYGENVSSPETRDYTYYKRGMLKTVQHIQAAIPGVPILIVSAHDRSVKQNGVYLTSPDIPILVNTQGELAVETGSAFWNLFEAMGGLNSMPAYVSARPQLAGPDYTHFTSAGANKIAGMLYSLLTTGDLD